MNCARIVSLVFTVLCASALLTASPVHAATEMDRAFERLEKDFKKLRDALEAPQEADRDQYAKLADNMLVEARKARELDPEMTPNVPEAQRAQFLEHFRHDMDTFIENIGKLSEALKNSKWDEARQLMEALRLDKKEGHKAYREKKK